jgi:recombination protein RecA
MDTAKIVAELKKDKALSGVVHQGSDTLYSTIPYYISTQAPTVDYAITQPGVPGGRLTTLIGPEGGGKSTLVEHLIAECQNMGGIALLVDAETRFSSERAKAIGIDLNGLVLIQGGSLEQSFDVIEKFIDQVRDVDEHCPVLVVYDSLAGAVSEKKMKADIGDVLQPGEVARFVSQNLPRLHLKAARNGVALVIINQLRTRINMNGPQQAPRQKVMGAQHTMTSEWPLLYWSSLMLHVSQIGMAGEEKDDPSGIRSRVIVRKCSIGPGEGRKAEIEIDKMSGINRDASLFDLLVKLDVIQNQGSRYRLDPDVFGAQPTFFRKDFNGVLAKYPALTQVAKDAVTLWEANPELVDRLPDVTPDEEGTL